VEAEAAVVGGGAAGLAAAAMLRRAGIEAVVFEAGAEVGGAWRGRYDRLHLHTPRLLSSLPGYRIPRAYGRWVQRDDVIEYLHEYAQRHGLEVHLESPVERIDADDGGWMLTMPKTRMRARHVVVATGFSRTPIVPDWPGRNAFAGELLHSSAYRNSERFRGRDVLVVGTGNSGAEIAVDLADGGASHVRLAVRTPPHIVRRDSLGVPAQALGIALGYLPRSWAGPLAATLRRLTIPDLAAQGLPRPREHLREQFARTGTVPVLDVGLIEAVRSGRVEVVGAVSSFERDAVVLTGGSRLAVDAVIAATGFRAGLEPLVGHLDPGSTSSASGRPSAGCCASSGSSRAGSRGAWPRCRRNPGRCR
jgi:cation diffusion facilitator CzcD-associated flavoprotein CzcO